MKTLALLSIACLGSAVSAATTNLRTNIRHHTPEEMSIKNANHIFNAIHSSMRQWGSTLQHNGMSFFMASVPKGTQFYHGTHQDKPIKGMEWLAFEPEHATIFANMGGPGGDNPPGEKPRRDRTSQHVLELRHDQMKERGHPRGRLGENEEEERKAGFLHTYVTKHNLRLLLVDGTSAGKSDKGTLDTQDYVILNDTQEHAGFWDYQRARGMCKRAKEEWDDKIDGVIRMEGGFEIILCSFKDNLDIVRMTRAKPLGDDERRSPDGGPHERFNILRAVTARYHGIGDNRVVVNYDSFVTAFTLDEDLFVDDKENFGLPRLTRVSPENMALLSSDVAKLVRSDVELKQPYNWQSVADAIINRYSSRLSYLVSGKLASINELHAEVDRTLRVFIDYDTRNATAETQRCTTQFLPSTAQDKDLLAARTVWHIAHTICRTLVHAGLEEDLDNAVKTIQRLITYLNWTTWKECRGCGDDEICFTPIWPQGTLEDWKKPSCRNVSGLEETGHGYWGRMGH